MACKEVKVYYLEMFSLPVREVHPPWDELVVMHARNPSVAYYRFLYNTVGKAYNWYSRGRMSDEQLGAILANPLNEIHVLHVEGVPAGFVELDRTKPGEIEIVQFGLMPEFIGQGLGQVFLRWAIEKAWSYHPDRLWLHTCTEDHPRALPNYQKAGFSLYQEEITRR